MRTTLEKIADINRNPYTVKTLPSELLYLDTGSITDNLISELQPMRTADGNIPSRARRSVRPNSIVYSCVRPNLCHYGLLKSPQDNLVVSTGFAVIDVKDTSVVDPEWLYYYLTAPHYTAYLSALADTSTSSYPAINPSALAALDITVPDSLTEQRKQVQILSHIADKVDANRQTIVTCEQMLRLLYDYWFTQFDFPNEDGEPYRASGGAMTHNDELGIDIPEGWEVKPLSAIVRQIKPKLTATDPVPMIDLSAMPNDSIYLSELHSSDDFTSNLFAMKKGSILFGSIRPYLHKAGIAPCDGAIAGTVYQFEPIETEFYNFALAALTHPRMFDFAVAKSQGTRMPVIKVDQLLSYKVPYNEALMRKFNELPIAEMATTAAMETQQLVKLRDFLLPLLMSGQVTVKTDDEEEQNEDE